MKNKNPSDGAPGADARSGEPVAEHARAGELEMEVFRAGDYGARGVWREEDLDQLARDYSPDLLEAPLTFDHARSGPAYGWVAALRRAGDRLVARLQGVPEVVRELVRAGAYKKRSVEILRRFAPTGRPYLRAVSLLGAATPAVPGLREIAFADSDEPLCFEDEAELLELRRTVAGLRAELGRLRQLEYRRHAQELVRAARERGTAVSPREAELVECFCEAYGASTDVMRFAEGELSPLEWIAELLAARAPGVPEERLPESGATTSFALDERPIAERADPLSLMLHRQALRLMQDNAQLDYASALALAATG